MIEFQIEQMQREEHSCNGLTVSIDNFRPDAPVMYKTDDCEWAKSTYRTKDIPIMCRDAKSVWDIIIVWLELELGMKRKR